MIFSCDFSVIFQWFVIFGAFCVWFFLWFCMWFFCDFKEGVGKKSVNCPSSSIIDDSLKFHFPVMILLIPAENVCSRNFPAVFTKSGGVVTGGCSHWSWLFCYVRSSSAMQPRFPFQKGSGKHTRWPPQSACPARRICTRDIAVNLQAMAFFHDE